MSNIHVTDRPATNYIHRAYYRFTGDNNAEKPDFSAYEIPELSQTAAVPEVSVSSMYTELKVNPYDTIQEENTRCMDREPGYVNTTQQYSSNTAGIYDN